MEASRELVLRGWECGRRPSAVAQVEGERRAKRPRERKVVGMLRGSRGWVRIAGGMVLVVSMRQSVANVRLCLLLVAFLQLLPRTSGQ